MTNPQPPQPPEPEPEQQQKEEEAAVDEEEEEQEIHWNLGFLEEAESPRQLLRHRFPSKVGGRPAWLDPVRLPSRQQLTCSASGRPLDFLLQVYAPVDANPEAGFHRALFLFISPEGGQLSAPGSVKLFRCQLPRSNAYYSPDPPSDRDKLPKKLQASAAEASRERDPWRSVDAEQQAAAASTSGRGGGAGGRGRGGGRGAASAPPAAGAAQTGGSPASLPRAGVQGPGGLYPEYEMIVEAEDDYLEGHGGDDEDEDEGEDEGEREEAQDGGGGGGGGGGNATSREVARVLQQYRVRVAEEGELDDEELPPDVVDAVEAIADEGTRAFADFQARVSAAPEQVIRYSFEDGAAPLWPSPSGRPRLPGDVPPCSCCGGPRKFEFQVLPQLLHYLRLNDEDPSAPDWSTLAAYTCAASCSVPAGADCAYAEEFVWVQPPQ